MSAATEIDRVHALVAPIAADLQLDVYDIERRGATMRITLDTLSLATRLISRELDHEDPIAGHYTLEVTSPGLERQLRTAAHFGREVGKTITVRLRDPQADPRRIQGVLTAADDRTATLLLDDGTERTVSLDDVDKARTIFEWGPKPKPGKQRSGAKKSKKTSEQGSDEQDFDEQDFDEQDFDEQDADEQVREQPSGTKSPTNTSNKEKRAS